MQSRLPARMIMSFRTAKRLHGFQNRFLSEIFLFFQILALDCPSRGIQPQHRQRLLLQQTPLLDAINALCWLPRACGHLLGYLKDLRQYSLSHLETSLRFVTVSTHSQGVSWSNASLTPLYHSHSQLSKSLFGYLSAKDTRRGLTRVFVTSFCTLAFGTANSTHFGNDMCCVPDSLNSASCRCAVISQSASGRSGIRT